MLFIYGFLAHFTPKRLIGLCILKYIRFFDNSGFNQKITAGELALELLEGKQ